METTVADGLLTVKFDLILTLALAALFLFVGYFVQRRVPAFSRTNIPAAAIGGLLCALVVFGLRAGDALGVSLNTSLRGPLQTAFFTTIGLNATLGLLSAGGWRMGFFWLLATLTAVVQNAVGIAAALALGAPPLLGVICGALTLTGGPATGLAWADSFESWGVPGAGALIIASAMFGIFTASLVGNPVATALIRRFKLAEAGGARGRSPEEEFWALSPTVDLVDETEAGRRGRAEPETELTGGVLLHNLLLILLVMGVGALVSLAVRHPQFTLPDYIGAMVCAAVVRNVDDRTGWFRVNVRAVEALSGVALALFLVLALMGLELWKIGGLALPMLVILAAQVVVMILYAVLVTFVLMGRDYEAAVTAGGHVGFGLGVTANAVANMEALTARYGPAPRSFLVVPIVGAFFIDFSNSLVISLFTALAR